MPPHWQGTYMHADGDVYEGGWERNRRNGFGRMTRLGADGNVEEQYEGDW